MISLCVKAEGAPPCKTVVSRFTDFQWPVCLLGYS